MSNTFSSYFDNSGVLRKPDLHDGWLDGILVTKDKVARLSVRDVTGNHYLIELTGLSRLRASDFREGNIIFDLTMFKIDRCPEDLLMRAYESDRSEHSLAFLEGLKKPNATEHYRVIEIASSYGCSVVAVFRDLRISPSAPP